MRWETSNRLHRKHENVLLPSPERWEEELAIDVLKTHQRQRPVLRSETPSGVMQEIDELLLGHYVIRKLMCEAALQIGCAPRELSFVSTLKLLLFWSSFVPWLPSKSDQ